MDRLSEALIYHKFGDCGWMILDYLADYEHRTKFAPVLEELITATGPINLELNWDTTAMISAVYDYCHGRIITWVYTRRGNRWKISSRDKLPI